MIGYWDISGRAIDDIQWSMVMICSIVVKERMFDPKYLGTSKKFSADDFSNIHAVDEEKKSVYIIAITHKEHVMMRIPQSMPGRVSSQMVYTRREMRVMKNLGITSIKQVIRHESIGIEESMERIRVGSGIVLVR